MKKVSLFSTVLGVSLLCAGQALAQTLKWFFPDSGGIIAVAGDGYGGIAMVFRSGPTEESARVVWVAPSGKVLLDQEFLRAHEDEGVAIVRMGGAELATRFIASRDAVTQSNVLRRFKRTRHGITTVDKQLEPYEMMPQVPERLTDPFGFFTFVPTGVRRYSN